MYNNGNKGMQTTFKFPIQNHKSLMGSLANNFCPDPKEQNFNITQTQKIN